MPIITIFLPTGYFSLSFDFRMSNFPECLRSVDARDGAGCIQSGCWDGDSLLRELPDRDNRAENQKWIDCHFERVAALFLRANQKRVSGLFTLICRVCLCIHDSNLVEKGTGAMTMVIKFLPVRGGLALVGYIETVEDDLNSPIQMQAISQNANCVTSFLTTLVRVRQNFLGQLFEAGIVVEWFEQRIETNRVHVGLAFGERFLEPIHRLVLIAEPEINQPDRVIRSVTRRGGQLLQNLSRGVAISIEGLRVTKKRERVGIVV